MGRNLSTLNIKDTYEGLVQISGSILTDGTGSVIPSIEATASFATSASYADTSTSASHAVNSDTAISSSYALTASYAESSSADSLTLQEVTTNGATTNVLTTFENGIIASGSSNQIIFQDSVGVTRFSQDYNGVNGDFTLDCNVAGGSDIKTTGINSINIPEGQFTQGVVVSSNIAKSIVTEGGIEISSSTFPTLEIQSLDATADPTLLFQSGSTYTGYVAGTTNHLELGDFNSSKVKISGSSLEVDLALTASGLIYPNTDGTSGEAIVTDGSGNLTFSAVTSPTSTLQEVTDAGKTTTQNDVRFATATNGGKIAVGQLNRDYGQNGITSAYAGQTFSVVGGSTTSTLILSGNGTYSSNAIKINPTTGIEITGSTHFTGSIDSNDTEQKVQLATYGGSTIGASVVNGALIGVGTGTLNGQYNNFGAGADTITLNGVNTAIIGGYNHTNEANSGFIGGGENHYIQRGKGAIVGGFNNKVWLSGERQVIVGGADNQCSSLDSFIGGGENNNIGRDNNDKGVILGGVANIITGSATNTNATYNTIINSLDSDIQGSTLSGIYQSSGSLILDKTGSVILGGEAVTATDNNTIYVPQLDVSNVLTGTLSGAVPIEFDVSNNTNTIVGGNQFIQPNISTQQYVVSSSNSLIFGNNNPNNFTDVVRVNNTNGSVVLASTDVDLGDGFGQTGASRNNAIIASKGRITGGAPFSGLYSTENSYINGAGNSRSHCVIVGGANQNINQVFGATIIGGESNTFPQAFGGDKGSLIGGGSNTIRGGGTPNIIGGYQNTITGGSLPNIIGGWSNTISGGGSVATILGSRSSTISGGDTIGIVLGQGHSIQSGYGDYCIGGRENVITGRTTSTFGNHHIGGYVNRISGTNTSNSIVIGGTNNDLGITADVVNSAILAGDNHDMAHDRSVILGGTGLSTNKDNEVVVPNLTISGSAVGEVGVIPQAGGVATMDCSTSNFFTLAMPSGGTTTLTPSNIQAGQTISVKITQNALASTLAFDGSIDFEGGTAFTISTGSGEVDVMTFVSFDGTSLQATGIKNFS